MAHAKPMCTCLHWCRFVLGWFALVCVLFIGHTRVHADPVPADVAFQITGQQSDGTLSVAIKVRQDYYLYKDKFALYSNGATVPLALPDGATTKKDPLFGTVAVYTQDVVWQQQIAQNTSGANQLVLWYQGCWEGGVCYPKQQFHFGAAATNLPSPPQFNASALQQNSTQFVSTPLAGAQASQITGAQQQVTGVSQVQESFDWSDALTSNNAGALAAFLADEHWWALLLLLFVAGLLLAFTPCVLPMVPIVYGIIMQQKNTPSTTQVGLLVGSYLLGMTIAFSALGMIVALLGANLQQTLQQPVFIGVFVIVLLILAGSMFDWYHLQLPASITQRIAPNNRSFGYVGAFALGLVSVLIVGPCVTPPLVAVLLLIGQTGDILLGGLGLATLSLGMGMPLLIAALLTTQALPRAGEWMVLVRGAFGFGLLALALYMVDRLIPVWLFASLCAFLLLLIAAALWRTRAISLALGWRVFLDGLLLLALLSASILLLRIWLPQQHMPATQTRSASVAADALDLTGTAYTLAALQSHIASYSGKTLVYFTADWCISCRALKKTVFADADVVERLRAVQLLVVDLTEHNQDNQRIQQQYDIVGPPTFVLFEGGKIHSTRTLVGEITTTQLLQLIRG